MRALRMLSSIVLLGGVGPRHFAWIERPRSGRHTPRTVGETVFKRALSILPFGTKGEGRVVKAIRCEKRR
jgi:hypothetical protein